MKSHKLETHEAAELFPHTSEDEIAALAEDIKEHGLAAPIVRCGGRVLDGRARLRACELAGVVPHFVDWEPTDTTSAVEFIVSANLVRRHLSKNQRADIALRLLPLFQEKARKRQLSGLRHGAEPVGDELNEREKGRALDQVAELTQLSPRFVSRVGAIKEADPAVYRRLAEDKLTVRKAETEVRQAKRRRELAEAAESLTVDDERFHLFVGDAEQCASTLPPESVDVILTDPPYPHEFIDCYAKLSRLAARVLKPGGLCVTMTGQLYLDEVFDALRSGGLKYDWEGIYMTDQLPCQVWQARVNSGWKPLLLFKKGERKGYWKGDVIKVPYVERGLHKWEQSIEGATKLAKAVLKPGQVVLDPFMGSGTFGVASLKCACRFVGIDIDPKNIEIARPRLASTEVGSCDSSDDYADDADTSDQEGEMDGSGI
jgi:ParB-like chromosome segregation protein Spo0J